MVVNIKEFITKRAYVTSWIYIDGVCPELHLPRIILVLRLYVVKTYNK